MHQCKAAAVSIYCTFAVLSVYAVMHGRAARVRPQRVCQLNQMVPVNSVALAEMVLASTQHHETVCMSATMTSASFAVCAIVHVSFLSPSA